MNASIKRHRQAERIQKHDIYVCCLQETHFRLKHSHRLKVRGWKKYIPCKWEAKQSWSSNPHIRQNKPQIKKIKRDTEGRYMMIKGSIEEEDIIIANI